MKSFYLENHDAFMRYLETPQDGPTIVYLPAISFSAAASFFDVVTHPDMPRHQALLVDYLGSGASDQPDGFDYSLAGHAACIAALMDSAGCRGATVMGHSMGGSVAIQLAITRPDLVGNLIVGEGNVTSGGGGLVRQIVAHDEAEFVGSAFPKMQAEIFYGTFCEQLVAKKGIEIAGLNITVPDKAEVEKARQMAKPAIDEWLKKAGPDGKKVLDIAAKYASGAKIMLEQ